MGIPIPMKDSLYIETEPSVLLTYHMWTVRITLHCLYSISHIQQTGCFPKCDQLHTSYSWFYLPTKRYLSHYLYGKAHHPHCCKVLAMNLLSILHPHMKNKSAFCATQCWNGHNSAQIMPQIIQDTQHAAYPQNYTHSSCFVVFCCV